MENKQAGFSIGQIIQHRLLDYRGVVIDIDPEFQGSEVWYAEQTTTGTPPKDEPWYHILIEGEKRTAYVGQRSLARDNLEAPIENPLLEQFFSDYKDGFYHSINALH